MLKMDRQEVMNERSTAREPRSDRHSSFRKQLASVIVLALASVFLLGFGMAVWAGTEEVIVFYKVVFHDDGTWSKMFYALPTDGASIDRLDEDIPGVTWWSYSPDGTRVLFDTRLDPSCLQDCTLALNTMDVDRGNRRRIHVDVWYPYWSPDGTRITHGGFGPSGDYAIYISSADGTNSRVLMSVPYEGWTVSPIVTAFGWTPDGESIFYEWWQSTSSDTPGEWGLVRVADGTRTPLAVFKGGMAGVPGSAAVASEKFLNPVSSPDGTRIAANGGGQYTRLVVFDISSGVFSFLEEANYAGPPYSDSFPQWSPDGESLVFARTIFSGSSQRYDLMKVDLRTGTFTTLLQGEAGSFSYWPASWGVRTIVPSASDDGIAHSVKGLPLETFDGGVPEEWWHDNGWNVIREADGNYALHGADLWQWAIPDYGFDKGWTDYTVRFRMKLISGGMQVECRLNFEEGRTRYMVGFREDDTWFGKEYPNNTYYDVCDVSPPALLHLGEWHDIEITLEGPRATVFVDGIQWFDCFDPSDPLPCGGIGFETIEDPPGSGSGGSYLYIDDVEVILHEK